MLDVGKVGVLRRAALEAVEVLIVVDPHRPDVAHPIAERERAERNVRIQAELVDRIAQLAQDPVLERWGSCGF